MFTIPIFVRTHHIHNGPIDTAVSRAILGHGGHCQPDRARTKDIIPY